MPTTCSSCSGIIRASNVPHNQAVWFEKKGDYHVYHCDTCKRSWNTKDVFLLKPVRLSFSLKRPACFLKSYRAGLIDHNKQAWYTVLCVGPVMVTLGKDMRQWRRVRNEQAA